MNYANHMPTDSQRLALAVARLNRRLRQERHSELTPSQLSVLGTLVSLGPTSPSAVAARERVSAPSVTRTINCLAEEGYVVREPHPDDGRQVVVTVSERGREVLGEERQRRDAWLHQRLKQLGPRERGLLREAAALMEGIAES